MNKQVMKKTMTLAGRELTLETGRLAKQAHGAVLARYGETVVLSTVVTSKGEDRGYFPLSVEFEEKLYSGGIIKGSRWVKRDGRPGDDAILTGRVIDRSIRPLFPDTFSQDVQIINTVMSVDEENTPDMLALLATTASLSISGIPWNGPVVGVRVGLVDDQLVLNPTVEQMKVSTLDLIVSSNKDNVIMVEMGGKEIPEQRILDAIDFAKAESAAIVSFIEAFASEVIAANGVGYEHVEKEPTEEEKQVAATLETIKERMMNEFPAEYLNTEVDKKTRYAAADTFTDAFVTEYSEQVSRSAVANLFEEVAKKKVREMIVTKGIRIDGRTPEQVRPLASEVGVLPRTHGSGLFTRGETQALSIATLGSTSLAQLIEGPLGEREKRYIHHYNFPPFSTGETGRVGSPKRREIGHGALAERALEAVLPTSSEFPYTIHVVSEVLSSNGSTSMASVCGSTLALMDAGVPIKAPVSGVAMGLIKEGDTVVILTDIMGIEDFYGDMDFKVAGTEKGINAMQMDVKIDGIDRSILETALSRANAGRMHILKSITDVIAEPRQDLSVYAPKIATLKINPEKIGELIGPGGKMIRSIQEAFEVEINVEEDGTVNIAGIDTDKLAAAKERVNAITKEVKVGEVYNGTVTRLMNFGAFVEILPGKEGLVHISELAPGYVEKVDDEVQVGDTFEVKVIEIDEQHRINLSRKALMGEQRQDN